MIARPAECSCDGKSPYCPVCLVAAVFGLAYQHPDSVSITMVKRRVSRITGREAALLIEASKYLERRR